jgi:hypothetical protein
MTLNPLSPGADRRYQRDVGKTVPAPPHNLTTPGGAR